jgi:glutamate N-acetyltransferase / amino-acid N-acetyltransferase
VRAVSPHAALRAPELAPIAGFRFGAVSAGIRKDGRVDLAAVVCDGAAVAAALFTKNRVVAAPVLLSAERVRRGSARALLVNSGCANAMTGAPGARAAAESTASLAEALGVGPDEVLCASTGVIGQLLPAPKIAAAMPALIGALKADGAGEFALAICTTDAFTKVSETSVPTPEGPARLLVVGKGAGMIHPDLGTVAELPTPVGATPSATMLVFAFTDALVERDALERALASACAATLNACSVDGDTSTNDTVIAFASGASGRRPTPDDLSVALHACLGDLARAMVRDGEGAEHAVELRVSGLTTDEGARRIARTVATSLLVKTALHGRDANWGRLLAAAGRAEVAFDPNRARVSIAGIDIVRDGLALGPEAEAEAQRRMAARDYAIELALGDGPGRASYLTSDLGHGYVDVNASYRS